MTIARQVFWISTIVSSLQMRFINHWAERRTLFFRSTIKYLIILKKIHYMSIFDYVEPWTLLLLVFQAWMTSFRKPFQCYLFAQFFQTDLFRLCLWNMAQRSIFELIKLFSLHKSKDFQMYHPFWFLVVWFYALSRKIQKWFYSKFSD